MARTPEPDFAGINTQASTYVAIIAKDHGRGASLASALSALRAAKPRSKDQPRWVRFGWKPTAKTEQASSAVTPWGSPEIRFDGKEASAISEEAEIVERSP